MIFKGGSYRGDISLDDVKFVDCAPPAPSNIGCLPDQFQCGGDNTCISTDQYCDMQVDCMDGSDERVREHNS